MSESMPFTSGHQQSASLQKRYGVITAKIGGDLSHPVSIEVELNEPEYSCFAPGSTAPNSKVRSAVNKKDVHYRYGERKDSQGRTGFVRTHSLPGAVHILRVEDISRLDPKYLKDVKWVCKHPGCAGKHWPSKAACIQSHPDQKELRRSEQIHLIHGVLEVPASKDSPALLDILSDEE